MRNRTKSGRLKSTQPISIVRGSHSAIEPLEGRRLLTVFTVTNTFDAGSGSLRQAMLDANAIAVRDTINDPLEVARCERRPALH